MSTQTLTNLMFIDDNNVVVNFFDSFTIGELSISKPEGSPDNDHCVINPKNYKNNFVIITPVLIDLENHLYTYNFSLDDTYRHFEYTGPLSTPFIIGYTYDENKNIVIPPCPVDGYILDDATLEWKPDPSLLYDINGDGKLYRYNEETLAWYPEC